jgi:hypothetical protein
VFSRIWQSVEAVRERLDAVKKKDVRMSERKALRSLRIGTETQSRMTNLSWKQLIT